MKGHNYSHGTGEVCKKCGKVHTHGLTEKKKKKLEGVPAGTGGE